MSWLRIVIAGYVSKTHAMRPAPAPRETAGFGYNPF
jgi:hypothetical protein